MSERKIEVTVTKSPDFRLVYTNGIFGSLTPLEGRMIFYVDRVIPEMVEDVPGKMRTSSVERELQVEVHMSPQQFLSISRWMQNHIKRMVKEGVLAVKEEKAKEEK